MTASLERFTAESAPDAIYEAIESDGAAIIEGLLPLDVVARVNAEVEDAVSAADPDEALFSPLMKAFHGPFTKRSQACRASRRRLRST